MRMGSVGRRATQRMMAAAKPHGVVKKVRKGTNGVSTNGITAFFMLFDGLFGYQSVKIGQRMSKAINLTYFFTQSIKMHYFCSDPISVDPICPQPKGHLDGAAGSQAPERRHVAHHGALLV